MEKGKEGTKHFQGMLTTPKIAFSSIKRFFPRAHIEKARKKAALASYVHKQETRLTEFTQKNRIPTIFEFQTQVAKGLGSTQSLLDEFKEFQLKLLNSEDIDERKLATDLDIDTWFMEQLDEYTGTCIESGERGLEFIAINPMWRSSWKRFWRSILSRAQLDETSSEIQPDGELHEGVAPASASESGSEAGEESGSEADEGTDGGDQDSDEEEQ